MSSYVITCSSTCDLTKEYLDKNNIKYINFTFQIDKKKYIDDFYSNISIKNFYSSLKKFPIKTAQPSPENYIKIWEPLLIDNKNILHIELSSGISGAYNSANIAKNILAEKYKNKICIIDSLCASSGYGYLINIANSLKDKYNFLDLVDYLNKIKMNITHLFFSTSLDQYYKGGRISKTAAIIGNFLNIIPIMCVDNNGKLIIINKERGLQKALNNICNIIKKNINVDVENKFYVCFSNCENLLKQTLESLRSNFKNIDCSDENVFNVGSVIGAHTGEGTIAIFYLGNGRLVNV